MDCGPQLHIAAIHAKADLRSDVPGLGVLCREGDSLLGAGRYSNSISRMSNYIAAGYQPYRFAGLRVGGMVGVIDGYFDRPIPAAAAFISKQFSWGETHLLVIPPVAGVTPLTVQVSVSF